MEHELYMEKLYHIPLKLVVYGNKYVELETKLNKLSQAESGLE